MGEVIDLPVWTKLDIEADKVLEGAIGKLDSVLILGWTADGQFYAACNKADVREQVYMAHRFIAKEMRGDFE